jgi:molecular chaperone DnaJ
VQRTRKISVKIPPGIEGETSLRISGGGDVGAQGGRPGDLYVVVHVKPHPIFKRDGPNLYCEVPVSFVLAALGGEMEVPTLDGKAKLKIPPGTQPGTVFRLKGKGMPKLRGFGRGDEFVRIQVRVPTKLTGRQKQLLMELGREMGII